jgi:hypothetical protein
LTNPVIYEKRWRFIERQELNPCQDMRICLQTEREEDAPWEREMHGQSAGRSGEAPTEKPGPRVRRRKKPRTNPTDPLKTCTHIFTIPPGGSFRQG